MTVTTGSVSSPLDGVLVSANNAEVSTEINGDIDAGGAGISIAARDEAVVNTTIEGDISAEKGSGIMVLAQNSDVTTTVIGDVSGESGLVPAAITAVSLSGDSSIEPYVDGNVTSETGAGILTGASCSSEGTAPSSQTTDDLKAGVGKSLTEVNGDVSGGAAVAPIVDNVVTCQMAGYPDNYAWNEKAKACQPGFLDDAGVFHPETTTVRKATIPATADKGLQFYTWILMASMVICMLCAVRLVREEVEG